MNRITRLFIVLIGGAGGTPTGSVPDEMLWDDGDVLAWDDGIWIAWDD